MCLVCQAMSPLFSAADEAVHGSSRTEEWTFSWWASDGSLAGWTSYRLAGPSRVWYCFGLLRHERPLLHVAEYDIARRSNPMIAKAESLWAEFICDAPFEQWTLGNETYAVELDDAEEGLGRAYGRAVPIACDLEWYAQGAARELVTETSDGSVTVGYQQSGVVLGVVETEDGPIDVPEIAAHRSHRWSTGDLSAHISADPDTATSPTRCDALGRPMRLAFAHPDGTVWDAEHTAAGLRPRR